MDKSLLVKMFGFPATLVHGDPLVLDRWRWLRERLPRTANGESLIDVGCGSGAFTIGAALRGYNALGLTWNEREQAIAQERAMLTGATTARFDVFDVRNLDRLAAASPESFDYAICCENIEHVFDDFKLMNDIFALLKPGGMLLLTAPNWKYREMSEHDLGPFSKVEDGGHVRRGYNESMLRELCEHSGMRVEGLSYCSGVLSQRLCTLQRSVSRIQPALGWASTLPLRTIPPLLDPWATKSVRWPYYSICLEAIKPRRVLRETRPQIKSAPQIKA